MEERDARRSTIERLFRNFFQSDHNLGDPIYPALPPEQAEIRATPPKGSLLRAIKMTKKLFPNHKIVTNFVYVPSEPTYNFFPFVQPSVDRSVLVAFMYKYHENVIRHAVCLKVCFTHFTHGGWSCDHVPGKQIHVVTRPAQFNLNVIMERVWPI